MSFIQSLRSIVSIVIVLGIIAALSTTNTSVAPSVNNIHPEPKISLTFDDGFTSVLTHAAPTLSQYGYRGTSYIIPACVDTSGVCRANEDASYMNWEQIKQLKEGYGWEIGAHSFTHPALTGLSDRQLDRELSMSKTTLAAQGIEAISFASPYGDYNNKTLAAIAKYFESHRGFWDRGYNRWPHNEYLLAVQQVQSGVSVAQVKRHIDTAARNKQWLILVFHDIKAQASNHAEDYEYPGEHLNQIAAYIKHKGISVVPVQEGYTKSNVNLLANASFDNGLQNGWHTDTPRNVHINTGNNGSYPSPKNSVRLSSGPSSAHLFSPTLQVLPTTTYMIKSFLKVETIVSGEVGYYVDEYDEHGEWISGQWKNGEKSAFTENISFPYRPSSSKVKQARLQVFVTPGSGIKAYVDNFQWFPMEQ